VAKVLGSETIEDFRKEGKGGILKTTLKSGLAAGTAILAPEFELGELAVGIFTDLIIDKAVDAFQELDVQEVYEQGTWVYVDRGRTHTRLVEAGEIQTESTLFQEWGDKTEGRTEYSPGFYINHVTASDESLVYVYDTEEAITVGRGQFRVAETGDKSKFDADRGMTMIREVYFLREQIQTQQYAKFQTGDEVRFKGKPYVVTDADAQTIYMRDNFNNCVEADPQAVTAGPRDHWKAQEPGQFRTVAFTFSVGDFAYRPLQGKDSPLTKRANGVLCCIFYWDGSTVEVFDCWTGARTLVQPNELVKPSLPTRKRLNAFEFTNFKKKTVNRLDPEGHRLAFHSKHEEVCWAYDMVLDFLDTRVLSSDTAAATITLGAKGASKTEAVMMMEQTNKQPEPNKFEIPTNLFIAGGLILAGIYFL
jgi:hypothetical protein